MMEKYGYYLIAVPTFLMVLSFGLAILLRRRSGKQQRLKERLAGNSGGQRQRPKQKESRGFLDVIAGIGRYMSHGHTQASLGEQLARAGYYGRKAPWVFIGVKVSLVGLAGTLAALTLVPLELSVPMKGLLVMTAATVVMFLPNMYVSLRRHHRCQEIRENLPDTVDLMEVCVSAGMGLDMAWNVVANEIRRVSGTLADEMALANLEIHLGAARPKAMKNLADRTGVEEIGSLAAVLLQTERFGTSVARALRTFASAMREERTFRAEESAEKMAVRLLFPMVLFIFPSVLVVAAGPAMITLARIFSEY